MVEKNYLKRFNITYPFQISLYDYITLRDLRLTFALNTILVQKTNCHKLINLANIKSFFFLRCDLKFHCFKVARTIFEITVLRRTHPFLFLSQFLRFLLFVSATLIAWVVICVYFHAFYKKISFIRSIAYEVSSDSKLLPKIDD